MTKQYQTPQEAFWAGDFGIQYIERNKSVDYLASNLNFFSAIFKNISKPQSLIEFGANVGMNLKAIKLLFPAIKLYGIEINEQAATELSSFLGTENVFNNSIFDYKPNAPFEVALIKGVLIHIQPEMLPLVYDKLYESSSKYILICEYYNPTPISVAYRGHQERLFKRDFAGEMLDRFPDLTLLNYGFCYRRDPAFPQDDVTWFLLQKK
jgi:pseudaminic acid biosynthesis-associated methylase